MTQMDITFVVFLDSSLFGDFDIFLGLGLLLAAYYVMKRRWMMDDEDTRLMFVFVERIIGMSLQLRYNLSKNFIEGHLPYSSLAVFLHKSSL